MVDARIIEAARENNLTAQDLDLTSMCEAILTACPPACGFVRRSWPNCSARVLDYLEEIGRLGPGRSDGTADRDPRPDRAAPRTAGRSKHPNVCAGPPGIG